MLKHASIIDQMKLEEKCYLLSGKDFWQTHSIKRLGVESVTLSDGPHGCGGLPESLIQPSQSGALRQTAKPPVSRLASRRAQAISWA